MTQFEHAVSTLSIGSMIDAIFEVPESELCEHLNIPKSNNQSTADAIAVYMKSEYKEID